VDSGSTHNFVQERVAKFLGLQLCQAQPFSVLVGSEEELRCDVYCPNVSLKIDSQQFNVDLFIKNGKVIQLQGQPKPQPIEATIAQFQRLASTDAIAKIFHLHLQYRIPNSTRNQWLL